MKTYVEPLRTTWRNTEWIEAVENSEDERVTNPYEPPAHCEEESQPTLTLSRCSMAMILWFASWGAFVFFPGSPSEELFEQYTLAYQSITAGVTFGIVILGCLAVGRER